ncbi:MAG: hypothetical protein LBB50_05190 [Oscillospiraceae bacterium]|nr:hypothetical protein [Oscillospiraceae bacterium]
MDNQAYGRRLAAPLLFFAALLTAGLLPLRIWQLLYAVEPGTGFWRNGGAMVMVLYAGLAVLVLVPIVAGVVLRRQAVIDLGRRRRVAEGICAGLVAAALVVSALMAAVFFINSFLDFGSGNPQNGFVAPSESGHPLQYFARTGALAALLEGVFALGSAVSFINLLLVDFLPKRKTLQINRLLVLMPLMWVVCRILRRFSRMISYLRVSDLFLSLLALAALMVFFLAFAQVLGGINAEGKPARLLAAGVPALVLLLLCFVPRLVAYRIQDLIPSPDAALEWCDPALALFIIVFLRGRLLRGENETAPASAPEVPEVPAAVQQDENP